VSSRREREFFGCDGCVSERCAKARHTFFHLFPFPVLFFLFFHGPSGPSTLAVSWHFGPASPIPFSPDFSVIEPIQTPPIFSFFYLARLYYTHVPRTKAQHCCHFDIVFYTGKKFGSLLCVVTQTTTIPAELFLFFSSHSL
jgi:hypothetical protein